MKTLLFTVAVVVVTLLGCGKTGQADPPLPAPVPEPTAVPTTTPTPAPGEAPKPLPPLPEGELYFKMPQDNIQATINEKGEVRILSYPHTFESSLTVAAKMWSHPFEEDPDKTQSPYTPFTCKKLEPLAKVAGSESPHLSEEAKRNALFWLRDAHEVLLRAYLPHLPGIGASFIPKVRKALGINNANYPTITILNPLSPSTIELVSIEKLKDEPLTLKAGNLEEIKRRFGIFFSSIAPLETPFVQKPLAFRDVLCDLSREAIGLRFQISTIDKKLTVDFFLRLKKEEP